MGGAGGGAESEKTRGEVETKVLDRPRDGKKTKDGTKARKAEKKVN